MTENSSFLSLNQAAKAANKSPSTISKYLKNGKLSYFSKDENGYKIDRSELMRVFPDANSKPIREKKDRTIANTENTTNEYIDLRVKAELSQEREKLQEKQIRVLEDRGKDLQTERDDWKEQAQTLLLQAPTKTPEKPPEAPKRFLGIFPRKTA